MGLPLKGYRSWSLCYVNESVGGFRLCLNLALYQLYLFSRARGCFGCTAALLSIADLSQLALFSHFSFVQLPLSICPVKDVGFLCCGSYSVGSFSNLDL